MGAYSVVVGPGLRFGFKVWCMDVLIGFRFEVQGSFENPFMKVNYQGLGFRALALGFRALALALGFRF